MSTWVLDRDPWAAVQSDDRGAGYDRYQVMNPPAGKYDVGDNGTGIIKRKCIAAMVCMYLTVVCRFDCGFDSIAITRLKQVNYGKFCGGPYPFLTWEPSDQKEIWQVADDYLSGAVFHAPGFRFSSNIDPAQMQGTIKRAREFHFDSVAVALIDGWMDVVFLASRSNVAWNFSLNITTGGIRPLLAPIIYPAQDEQAPRAANNLAQFVLVYTDLSPEEADRVQLLSLDANAAARDWLGPMRLIGKAQKTTALAALAKPQSVAAVYWDKSAVVIVTDDNNAYSASKMSLATGTLSKIVDGTLH